MSVWEKPMCVYGKRLSVCDKPMSVFQKRMFVCGKQMSVFSKPHLAFIKLVFLNKNEYG
jgi:hypothetical protein